MPRRTPRLQLDRLDARDLPAVAPFSIVALPDTQFYAQDYPGIFNAQTQWIVNNRVGQNIAFATGLGDTVNHGSDTLQWQHADAAYDKLDGKLPYSVTLGNHDYASTGVPSSGAVNYLANFGPQRYSGYSWYLGGSSTGQSHAQTFSAGGFTFLHLNLEWEPDGETLDWAQAMISSHPGMPTIISTHLYLGAGGDRPVEATTDNPNSFAEPIHHSAEAMFRQLVQVNPQVFLVLSGHFGDDSNGGPGEASQVSTNSAGSNVYEMVSDYQSQTNGGNGYLRILQFDVANNKLNVKSYSPTLNQYLTDANSQFSFSINFAQRFAVQPITRTSEFQDGVNFGAGVYSGTQDTEIKQAAASTNVGSSTSPVSFQADSGDVQQTLLRFDRLVGNGVGQVPAGATIVSAELIVNTTNGGDGGALYRMVGDWSESSTWNSLGGGIQANGTEARTTYDSQVGFPGLTPNVPIAQELHIDVTRDLRSWVGGTANKGWAFLPFARATDAVSFSPSESANKSIRPRLKVVWIPASISATRLQEGDASYAGTTDTALSAGATTTGYGNSSQLWTDAPDPANTAPDTDTRQTLLRFDLAGLSTKGRTLQAAFLGLTTPYTDDNSKGSGFRFYRVLQPWTESSTFANSFGGNGVQNDNLEARSGSDGGTGTVDYGFHLFDVTSSVKAWLGRTANYGWVFRSYGGRFDGTLIASSEFSVGGNRPVLVLVWQTSEVGTPPGSGVVTASVLEGYTGVMLGDAKKLGLARES